MKSIRTELVALDTNEYIFAIRADPAFTACEQLLSEFIHELRIYLPLQVKQEAHANLTSEEQVTFYDIIASTRETVEDYIAPPTDLIGRYRLLGAKKGDAVIAAHLHRAGIRW